MHPKLYNDIGDIVTTKGNENVRLAYTKGYRVQEDGRVIGASGIFLKLQKKIRHRVEYYRFGIKNLDNMKRNVDVHRLAGYQKFGEDALKKGIEVRHLNNISLDNSEDNIDIGTARDNRMDIPPEVRMKRSIHASSKKRKFSDDIMEEIREKKRNGATYKQLMEEYDISSKGTMSHIINNKYVTKV